MGPFVVKCSSWTKVEMAMVKTEKVATKEACKAKKFAKQMAMAKLGSTKKLPKTSKGEKEKTFKPLNLERGEGRTSMEKESSKGEASKDNI